MTTLFDDIVEIRRNNPNEYKKIVLKIIDHVMTNVHHSKGWWAKLDISWVSSGDCLTADKFIDYLAKLRRLIKGEEFLTGYRQLDFDWQGSPRATIWDFIDSFHDTAHYLRKHRQITNENLIFGLDIADMIRRTK